MLKCFCVASLHLLYYNEGVVKISEGGNMESAQSINPSIRELEHLQNLFIERDSCHGDREYRLKGGLSARIGNIMQSVFDGITSIFRSKCS